MSSKLTAKLMFLIVSLSQIHTLAKAKKATLSSQRGAEDESPACSDRHACLAMELDAWFSSLQDKKVTLTCEAFSVSPDPGESAAPLFTLAADCNDEGAVWQYKYMGAKGKNRIFHGAGKLSFTKMSTPPHGYDYGMKSGRCLQFAHQDEISAIEGHFVNGVLVGEAELSYFDGKVSKVSVHNGVIHGIVRQFESVRDKETNVESPVKRLYSISTYRNGQQFGFQWTLKEDGTKVLTNIDSSGEEEQQALAIVPLGGKNGTKYLAGKMDEEDMMVSAREVKLLKVDVQNCMNIPTFEPFGAAFDYDLEVKSPMKATVAKLVRFFEIVADEKVQLDKNFAPNPEPINKESALRIISTISKEKHFFNVKTIDGPCKAIFEGNLNEKGMPSSYGTYKILSEVKRRDMIGLAKDDVNATDADVANDASNDTVQSANEQNNDAYLEEYIPIDQLPFRSFQKLKKISTIKGFLDHGGFQGIVRISHVDGSTTEGLAVDGIFHGVVRELAPPFSRGRRKRYVKRLVENVVISSGLMGRDEPIKEVTFVASYKNGFIDGPGWKFMVGGCYLFGNFKKTSTFTTNHGAFINQDLETCYFGRFVDGKMMSGQMAEVIGEKTVDSIKVPMFSEPTGITYRFAQGEQNQLTDPLVPDITENNWVYVGKSTLGEEVGEGLFAKRDIPENTVVAFFGGLRYSYEEWNKTGLVDPNYWIKTDEGDVIYVPEEFGKTTDKYKATLGHKINHSFSNWNCMFHNLDHPRFGLIPAVRTTNAIDKDHELLCLYEMKFHEGAPWYQELWRKEIDNDFVHGPFGHRGERKNESEDISPMITNASLYNEFYRHAVEVLKLDPMT